MLKKIYLRGAVLMSGATFVYGTYDDHKNDRQLSGGYFKNIASSAISGAFWPIAPFVIIYAAYEFGTYIPYILLIGVGMATEERAKNKNKKD